MNNNPSPDMYVILYKNQLIFTSIFIKVPTLYGEIESERKFHSLVTINYTLLT